jgi:hypothetical protein
LNGPPRKAVTPTGRIPDLRVVVALVLALTAPVVDLCAGDFPADGGPGLQVELFPDAEFYPQYTADPLRPQSALKIVGMADSEIPESGSARFALHLGGRFDLARWHPDGQPDRGWQLDFEGGSFGQFDIGDSLDNIGWDGLFGLTLSWLPRAGVGLRVGTKHDSAHLGDEYAERTGRERIGHTREELVIGVSLQPAARWRLYPEGGLGYGLEELQEPGRLQVGVERRGARRFRDGRLSWYAAADLQSFQESDWKLRSALQLGFLMPTGRGTSRYRLALELVHGRSVMGEFSFHDETSIGVGWYLDY